jgi:ribosomal protein S3AE
MEDAYNIGDVTFRQIRSEAERKRDAIISIIDKAYKECPHSEAVPHAIYEAIAEHIR